jgi:peptidoglycan/LPS O-acetylase OafA/YrhL
VAVRRSARRDSAIGVWRGAFADVSSHGSRALYSPGTDASRAFCGTDTAPLLVRVVLTFALAAGSAPGPRLRPRSRARWGRAARRLATALELPVFVWLRVRSYSIYLRHRPVLAFTRPEQDL